VIAEANGKDRCCIEFQTRGSGGDGLDSCLFVEAPS
jgi:hypothetical protein